MPLPCPCLFSLCLSCLFHSGPQSLPLALILLPTSRSSFLNTVKNIFLPTSLRTGYLNTVNNGAFFLVFSNALYVLTLVML